MQRLQLAQQSREKSPSLILRSCCLVFGHCISATVFWFVAFLGRRCTAYCGYLLAPPVWLVLTPSPDPNQQTRIRALIPFAPNHADRSRLSNAWSPSREKADVAHRRPEPTDDAAHSGAED
ncbi:hypothetical protein EJ06DRAFT_236071 [Trichodelitschia bisporula]|uniref:Uncharacterized protein n=1 Tax=Trichodelitschia bisporula TaxID=703511 RepID=A0A6G1HK15_9PEZI|nr:hypothetical protein EJ06DRAFT_236071 [Trichodelitschia bisporula]